MTNYLENSNIEYVPKIKGPQMTSHFLSHATPYTSNTIDAIAYKYSLEKYRSTPGFIESAHLWMEEMASAARGIRLVKNTYPQNNVGI